VKVVQHKLLKQIHNIKANSLRSTLRSNFYEQQPQSLAHLELMPDVII